MFVLADILLGNAAAFLAALMVADQFPLLRVGRGSGVVGYAAFFITVLCMFMYTLRYPLKAFFCVLMLAGLQLLFYTKHNFQNHLYVPDHFHPSE